MLSKYHDQNCKCNVVSSSEEDDFNETNYAEIVKNLEAIELLIVGNEPYPSGSNGIAFCKNTWRELLDGRCGGRYLLCSLGIDLGKIQRKYATPVFLFMEMAKKGIVCVNQHDELLSVCLMRNPNVSVTCGSKILGDVVERVEKLSTRLEKVERHPSPQGVISPPDKRGIWYKYWGAFENLLNILESSGNGPIHDAINLINT